MANPRPASPSYGDANQMLRLVQILISPGIVYSIATNSRITRWKNLITVHYNFIDIAVSIDSKPCIISRVIISIIKIQFVELQYIYFWNAIEHLTTFPNSKCIELYPVTPCSSRLSPLNTNIL